MSDTVEWKYAGAKIHVSREFAEEVRQSQAIWSRVLESAATDMVDTFLHGPKHGPWLKDVVPEELRWENSWYWETPHDWEEDDDE